MAKDCYASEKVYKIIIMLTIAIAMVFFATSYSYAAEGYMELKAVDVVPTSGTDKQVFLELRAFNMNLKGFDIKFSYPLDKIKPSTVHGNDDIGIIDIEELGEIDFFTYEEEFTVLEILGISSEDVPNWLKIILSILPPIHVETTHIKSEDGNPNSYYIKAGEDGVLLGTFSYKLFNGRLTDDAFFVTEDENVILVTTEGTIMDKSKFHFVLADKLKNANLSNIQIDGTNLSGFDKNIFNYEIDVDYNKSNIDIKPILEESISIMEIKKYILNEEDEEELVGTVIIDELTGIATSTLEAQGKKTIFKIIVTAEDGTEKTYTLTVDRDEIIGLIITPPTKLIYKYNEDLNLENGKLKPVLKSGKATTEVDLNQATLSNYNKLVADDYDITVQYGGYTLTEAFTVTVIDVVGSITLNNPPTEVEWGEDIDLTGFTITLHYLGGTADETIQVTADMLSGYIKEEEMLTKTEQKTITVTYDEDEEVSSTFNITVDNPVVEMELSKNSLDVNWGEDLDLNDVKYKEILKSGAEIEDNQVTADMVTGYNKNATTSGVNSIQTAIVTHPEVETLTKEITINVLDVIDKIEIAKPPTKTTYKYGQTVDLTGGELTATRASGGTSIVNLTDVGVAIEQGNIANTVGTHIVTIGYAGKTTTLNVTVLDYVTEIDLENTPEEVEWDEEINLDDFKIILKYLGTTPEEYIEVLAEMLSGYEKGIDPDSDELNGLEYIEKIIRVTYTANAGTDEEVVLHKDFTIKVTNPIVSIEMKTIPKTEYILDDELDITVDGETPAQITVTRKNGWTFDIDLTEDMVTGFDSSEGAEELELTVTYEDSTTTYNVKIKAYGYIEGSISTANSQLIHIAQLKLYKHEENIDWKNLIDRDDLPQSEIEIASSGGVEDGSFSIEALPGEYDLLIDKAGYLDYIVIKITIVSGETVDLGQIILLTGDANKDGVVDLADDMLLSEKYTLTSANINYLIDVDFNEDGTIDLADSMLLSENYTKKRQIIDYTQM